MRLSLKEKTVFYFRFDKIVIKLDMFNIRDIRANTHINYNDLIIK